MMKEGGLSERTFGRRKQRLIYEVHNELKKRVEKGLHQNYYATTREWPYKNVKHRIIAEQYMTNDDSSPELTDYKFFCFDGYVDCVMVCLDRHLNDTKFYFFNKDDIMSPW